MATYEGTAGSDSFAGDAGSDEYRGGDGDDRIYDGSGDDTVYGGAGNDVMDDRDGVILSGNDTMYGGAGDDAIWSGGDQDLVYGGDGADWIDGEWGHDTLHGDAGNDWINGNDGDDTVYAGSGDDSAMGGAGDDSLDGGDGRDRLAGEAGNDSLHGRAGDDTAAGGAGDDRIDGGDGNDLLAGDDGRDTVLGGVGDDIAYGGAGDDSLGGWSGNDVLAGGAGNDSIDGGAGNDLAYGGDGNDRIEGGDGNDRLAGDAGNDTVLGGVGDDAVVGGAGDDSLGGWSGNDVLMGGAGADRISTGSGLDRVVLGAGGGADRITDFDLAQSTPGGAFADQIDVAALRDADGNPVDAWDVVVTDDGGGNALLTFPGGETLVLEGVPPASVTGAQALHRAGIPCFTAGTPVRVPGGAVPVERLRVGDLVVTRDDGPRPLRWAAMRRLGPADLAANERLRPVRIEAGAFGNAGPLLVSRQHAVLVRNHAGEERFVRAAHLSRLRGPGARVANGLRSVTYVHLMFDRHQVLSTDGVWSESFYPGREALRAAGACARREIAALFPDLGTDLHDVAPAYGAPARAFVPASALPARLDRLRAPIG